MLSKNFGFLQPVSKPVYEIVVTPEVATLLLSRLHPRQRSRKAMVRKYADLMRSGQFKDRWGVPFAFDMDGQLINGKQRCLAVLESGATITVYATTDHCGDDIDVLDPAAATRTSSDVLSMRGVPESNTSAAAIRWIWMIVMNEVQQTVKRPSNKQIVSFLENNTDLPEAVIKGRKLATQTKMLPGGMASAIIWITSILDDAKSEEFFDRLIDGANLEPTSPIYLLRRKFEKVSSLRNETRMPVAQKLAMTVIAWNAFQSDTRLVRILWLNGPFPKINGITAIKPEDLGF